jgi:hypothetical protein
MVNIEFQVKVVGGAQDNPLLDEYEIGFLLETTKHHITQHVQSRLAEYHCEEHGQPPCVVVSGQYDLETEQLDVQYSVEACCNRMVMQSVALLSR